MEMIDKIRDLIDSNDPVNIVLGLELSKSQGIKFEDLLVKNKRYTSPFYNLGTSGLIIYRMGVVNAGHISHQNNNFNNDLGYYFIDRKESKDDFMNYVRDYIIENLLK